MNQIKTTYHHGDLKRALIDRALETIVTSGVQSLSLRACARALDVDVAATYRHFKNKNDLLAAVAATGFGMLGESMLAQSASCKTPRTRLEAIGQAYVRFALDHEHLFAMMFNGPCHADQIDARRQELLDDATPGPHEQLVATLDALAEAGAISPAHRPDAELLAWSAIHGLASLLLTGRGDTSDVPQKVRACCAMLLGGLAAS